MNKTFKIYEGTVQCYVARCKPFYMKHFGRPEYDRTKPVLSDRIRHQAHPVVDGLNNGTLTIEEAEKQLDKIW